MGRLDTRKNRRDTIKAFSGGGTDEVCWRRLTEGRKVTAAKDSERRVGRGERKAQEKEVEEEVDVVAVIVWMSDGSKGETCR